MLASCRLLLSLSRLAAEPCGSLAIMQAERIVASAGASTSQPQHALPLMATTPHHQAALLEQRRYYRMKQPWQHLPSRVLPDKIREIIENKLAERAANRIPDPVITLPEAPRELTPNTRRCGLVGMKVGMTHEWDEHGALVPLTVIWVDKCQVVALKTPERNGYWALVMGGGSAKVKHLHPAVAGQFLSRGLPLKRRLEEYMVSEDALMPVGTEVRVSHFRPGQWVDVAGHTKNKGWQGVMKKWGFKGLAASHGVSGYHRGTGSIGSGRTDPGKVWKGKKMAGRMGGDRQTVRKLEVFRVDPARNIMYVKGSVPGTAGDYLFVRDALNAPLRERLSWQLPVPTALLPAGQTALEALPVETAPQKDPYHVFRQDVDFFPLHRHAKRGAD